MKTPASSKVCWAVCLPVAPDFSDWLDFKLLPEFKKVSKYFHYTVSGMQVTKQGINLRVFAPTPPELK